MITKEDYLKCVSTYQKNEDITDLIEHRFHKIVEYIDDQYKNGTILNVELYDNTVHIEMREDWYFPNSERRWFTDVDVNIFFLSDEDFDDYVKKLEKEYKIKKLTEEQNYCNRNIIIANGNLISNNERLEEIEEELKILTS